MNPSSKTGFGNSEMLSMQQAGVNATSSNSNALHAQGILPVVGVNSGAPLHPSACLTSSNVMNVLGMSTLNKQATQTLHVPTPAGILNFMSPAAVVPNLVTTANQGVVQNLVPATGTVNQGTQDATVTQLQQPVQQQPAQAQQQQQPFLFMQPQAMSAISTFPGAAPANQFQQAIVGDNNPLVTQQQNFFSSAAAAATPSPVTLGAAASQFNLFPASSQQALQTATAPIHCVASLGTALGNVDKRDAENDVTGHVNKKAHSEHVSVNNTTVAKEGKDDSSNAKVNAKEELDFENMSPEEKRRHERNLREQQRSGRINQQIQDLRHVLAESKIPFKPNKFSILASVHAYIKDLQSRSVMLEVEQRKLVATLEETNKILRTMPLGNVGDMNGQAAVNVGGGGGQVLAPPKNGDENQVFLNASDYRSVFDQCSAALGVASVDGRILACNLKFEELVGCSRQQMQQKSLFTLIQNHQEIFEALAGLLKRADDLSTNGASAQNGNKSDDASKDILYWCGQVMPQSGSKPITMIITLACTDEGNPKFFSFSMAPS